MSGAAYYICEIPKELFSSIARRINSHYEKYSPWYSSPVAVFAILWITAFLLYLIAMWSGQAGSYFVEWLQVIREESFWSYINRPGTTTLYQFTQLITYLFYKMFGGAAVPWHLLHLTFHVANCSLLYMIYKRVLQDSETKNWRFVSISAVLLFCISPYNSEVVVHEPCFHYTIGFTMFLLPLLWMQYYLKNPRPKYALWSVLLYIPATYSLEVFYITPWAILAVAMYYKFALRYNIVVFRRVILFFVLPMLAVFAVHLVLIHLVRGSTLPHGASTSLQTLIADYLNKAPKYFFHIVLLGRFWTNSVKQEVYHLLNNDLAIALFHLITSVYVLYVLVRFKKTSIAAKFIVLNLILTLLFIALVSNREFPSLQYISLDRYVYFSAPFIYLIMCFILFRRRLHTVIVVAFGIYLLVSTYLLLKVNKFWMMSNQVVESLINSFPDPGNKTVVLLNPPENMHGAAMIRSNDSSCFRVIYNTTHKKKLTSPIFEVASYNMLSPDDGAHVNVINDSTLHVTLNNWGTWWWHNFLGGSSYSTQVFRLNMVDKGHWYELTLTKPVKTYLLLYCVGGEWKHVDMSIRDKPQD